ncbi:hypothetical protein [Vallicoccus soli]|uniref:Uncharacterized protein n=1 Tax=Vallicoccus soli TaxID=2339232 RepID=A0A3A3ZIM6_9ACTN|nr:hypothetical protein [Vallicoccus soli]RJK95292.1 hypothetical protein D5H78_11520 [Vallicoccus soli]
MPSSTPAGVSPADSTARPVVALYDGSTAARDTVLRAAGTAARTLVVAPPGAEARLGDVAGLVDGWVRERTPTIEAALRTAVEHDAPWVCVPSSAMPSEDLLRDGLRAAVGVLGEQRPGLVLHVVRTAGISLDAPAAAVRPYGRVVLVSDLEETTGLASYAAAAVAARSGAELDVVVSGRDEQGDELQRLVTAAGERTDPTSLLRARHALHAGGVPVRYLGGGAGPDAVAGSLQVVEGLQPDLLVVGLGARALLEMAPGRAPRLEETLAGARGRLVGNLLTWLAVDVALVLDPVGPATAVAAARADLARTVDATLAGVA